MDVCAAWAAAGRRDTVAATLVDEHGGAPRHQAALAAAGELPPWLGRDDLHRSHRSALVRKDPDHYRPLFGDDLPDDLPYVWPVSDRAPRP